MRVLPLRIVLTVVLGLLFASPLAPAYATEGRSGAADAVVGHFSHVEGSVTRLQVVARVGMVLLAGDEVHVAMGRAEITLTDGSALQLDEHTRVALHAVDRVQVLAGRMYVRRNGSGPLLVESGGRRLHVMPGSDVEVTAANGHDLLVRVVEGDARIESSWGNEAVGATQSAFVSGATGRPFVARWVASPHDMFHRWAGGRRVVLVPPAAFLPYAHPTYRQQEYERLLRRQRVERRRAGGFTRRDGADETERGGGDHAPKTGRREARRDDERSDEHARRGRRRARQDETRLRSEASARQAAPRDAKRKADSAPRDASRPPAKPPAAVKPRVPTVGVVVRRP